MLPGLACRSFDRGLSLLHFEIHLRLHFCGPNRTGVHRRQWAKHLWTSCLTADGRAQRNGVTGRVALRRRSSVGQRSTADQTSDPREQRGSGLHWELTEWALLTSRLAVSARSITSLASL